VDALVHPVVAPGVLALHCARMVLSQLAPKHDNCWMQNTTESAMIPEHRKVLKRLHYPLEVMLMCIPLVCCLPVEISPFGRNDAGAMCLW
jgi:hypothetical protein